MFLRKVFSKIFIAKCFEKSPLFIENTKEVDASWLDGIKVNNKKIGKSRSLLWAP